MRSSGETVSRIRSSSGADLRDNPRISCSNTAFQGPCRFPAERFDSRIAKIAGLNPNRALDVTDPNSLTCHTDYRSDKLVHSHVLGIADIDWSFKTRLHQSINSVDHLIDIGIAAHRGAISPYFDLSPIQSPRNLSADCRR